jgi:hypothetical protein
VATQRVVSKYAPELAQNEGTMESLAAEVLSALRHDPVTISARFFLTPGLNPGFIKARERLIGLLAAPSVGLDQRNIDLIGSKLGKTLRGFRRLFKDI